MENDYRLWKHCEAEFRSLMRLLNFDKETDLEGKL